MNNTNRPPSIFTPKDELPRLPLEPRGITRSASRLESPSRRQSTPDWLERNTVQAAAAEAAATPVASVATLAPFTFAAPATSTARSEDPLAGADRADKTGGAAAAGGGGGGVVKNNSTSRPLPPAWPTAADNTGFCGRRASVSTLHTVRTPPGELPPTSNFITPGSGEAQKRKRAELQSQHSVPELSSKRPRFRAPKTKHTLDGLNFNFLTAFSQPPLQPLSPLFFSHSPRPRPVLPPRFSSSEAGARMLNKARTEDTHVKTVSLARGTVSTPVYSPTSAPRPELSLARRSLDRSSTGRSTSPDFSGGEVGILNSIGVIELLEQDERPTFIVDLSDGRNYGPGELQLVFANPALRSYNGMLEAVSGANGEDSSPGPRTYLQLKSWLLSASVDGESLNVCLPSFVYAGMTWSCSTLRKRLRVVSGAFTDRMARESLPPSSIVDSAKEVQSASTVMAEPNDYFGSATVDTSPNGGARSNGHSARAEVVPTIESTERNPLSLAKNNANDLAGSTHLLPSASTYVQQIPGGSEGGSITRTPSSSTVDSAHSQIALAPADEPFFDWTRLPVTDSMPQHIRFTRSVDWAATALGPIEFWPSDLRQMCNLIMASPHPAAMYWGDDLIAIYNEAYILLAGQKHPALMGQSYSHAWQEIWDDVKDVFASAKMTGQATMKDDDCLFMKRNDYLEETYFSWSIIPMVGRDGSVMGLYNPAFEKTRRKIAERRMLTLREVGERTASARDVKGFWSQVLDSFELNAYDSPFLLLYSVSDDLDSDASSMHSNSVLGTRQLFLEGSLGVPDDHVAAPLQIDLKHGMEGFGPVFREVMKTDKPVLLEVGTKDLPQSLLDNLSFRGFGDPVRAVVICPIHPTTGENILGFLVLGVNPRRPYDDDYSLFIQLLSRQLATSLASVVLFEEEIRRGQRAAKLAALDRIQLSEQLAARTQEAIDSETKFTRMAEFAPVGMFITDHGGRITFANDTWYEISGVSRRTGPDAHLGTDTWMEAISPLDSALVTQLWDDLVTHTQPVSSEFRFRRQWRDRNGNSSDTWVLFSAYPEKYDDGRLKSAFGSITNISQQKWAEGIQTRKMEEAVELKRQQENFIDITSHEMRNPLSAILQCGDEITASLTKFRQGSNRVMSDELLASCLDAGQIISLCAHHQKRIVDDVLTLSKLDSALLLVTPVDSQPLTVVQRALKMHEGELQAADIQLKFVVDQSYRDLDLDWVRLDPSRVMQVLINLTTNAIKFTGTESKRTITVTISATTQRPSEVPNPPVSYFPTRNKRKDAISGRDWGEGEVVYVHFSVEDTGRGLKPDEKKMLFMRFSQASPRTHVQYGGSGLGLFISRELTELQGGEIGVESESGKGSTFAFYVAARRSVHPPEPDTGNGLKRADGRRKSMPSAAVKAPAGKVNGPPSSSGAQMVSEPMKKKVLIVEDNLVNQRVLQKQLKNLGTEVHVANHGGEALEKLRQSTYWAEGDRTGKIELGVVLMDQEMPVMDGLTCTRKIRELEAEGKLTGHIPIIAVTANARSEQIQTALQAGMDDVVSKPFRIAELVPKIEELMLRYPMPSAEGGAA
ncbi:hypothetical protein LTR62_003047 [Meristemomyces frigidus]|uniref:Uncharacterized protein n=1 Tax=Meristemomyces frigidus TaxID=1508187 RepID=A0AAN7TLL0_9PEZI|nr:hypothetical protein LTR62_003047 [Meristemomyces frigidus]